MSNALTRFPEGLPTIFDDFFRPWNQWFENNNPGFRTMNVPAVNITEKKDAYEVSLAAPGLKKEDFKIAIEGNMLTISSEKEDSKEETEDKATRKEYNYSSFSRSFTLPEGIKQDGIEAKYENGILMISLPRKEDAKKLTARQVTVH